MEYIKTYFEETIAIILVITLGISTIIITTQYSIDNKEKECVEFYKKNNYILNDCEIYKEKLINLKKGE